MGCLSSERGQNGGADTDRPNYRITTRTPEAKQVMQRKGRGRNMTGQTRDTTSSRTPALHYPTISAVSSFFSMLASLFSPGAKALRSLVNRSTKESSTQRLMLPKVRTRTAGLPCIAETGAQGYLNTIFHPISPLPLSVALFLVLALLFLPTHLTGVQVLKLQTPMGHHLLREWHSLSDGKRSQCPLSAACLK